MRTSINDLLLLTIKYFFLNPNFLFMKTIQIIVCLFVLSFGVYSCSKEGPAGPQGDAGPTGPQGIAGNANVTQYTYGPADFITNSQLDLAVTTTADTMNRSLWYVYLSYAGGAEYFYPMPGLGYNAASYYRHSYYFNTSLNKVIHSINRVNGAGEVYSGAKIIRVYINNTSGGGRISSPPVDFGNYQVVRNFYQLP